MSGGRVELGLGAGWYGAEHAAFGIPFPDLGERFERLEEQFEVITGLWATEDGANYEHHGRHYTVVGGTGLPKPAQSPRPPLLVGGLGPKRTPALAARFADEFNVPFADADATGTQFDRVRSACEEVGRSPSSMIFSAAQVVCVGGDEAEVARRAAAIGREVDELRTNGIAGSPDEAIERIRMFAAQGAQRIYLQVLDLHDLDHLRLIAEEVMPATA
jgi:alkanesulfonate monooxygenase SsuD/methylene tetrahydromethanopterin reductase-like flavin-dependent oxidoreductase (luciferase family)